MEGRKRMTKTAQERATARAERSRAVAEAYAAELANPEQEAAQQAALEYLGRWVAMRDQLAAEHKDVLAAIGAAVREAAKLGIGPGKLAEVTGLSRQQVTNYTHGRTSSRKLSR
jgi:hypothetical protein